MRNDKFFELGAPPHRPDPIQEYSRSLAARRDIAAGSAAWHVRLGNARLMVACAAAIAAWLVFRTPPISPWWLTFPLAAFLGLVIIHDRVKSRHRRAVRAAAFFERGIDRIEGRWAGKGEPGDRFKDARHPYAEDLDLFGKGSLFELLCTAGTGFGMGTLAAWLKTPARPEEIRRRQEAVEELRPRLGLREDLAVLGADIGAAIDSDALANWGSAAHVLSSPAARVASAALASLAVVTLCVWAVTGEKDWFLLSCCVEAVFALRLRRSVRHVMSAVEEPGRDLALLSRVMQRIERENFSSALLQDLRLGLDAAQDPPSTQIARLNRLVVLLDSRRNAIFAPLACLLLWGTQFAFALESWRLKHGRALSGWLQAIGEIEALCALAGYAYEHPLDPFPEIAGEGTHFEAEGMAHPLLPAERAVGNDIRFGDGLRALVVSGSNMSGKSTLLRSVGTCAVLGLAGGPVRARRLRLTPLSIGASIRTMDSLQEGSSRFYAEITRIRQIVELAAGERPLLFLLDELLQGTNSHDRAIGAEAIIRGLLERGAIGLVTTHDLALSRIAENLAPRTANVHFEDHIEDGRIAFDYRLQAGVVQRSNALELMRAVGLSV